MKYVLIVNDESDSFKTVESLVNGIIDIMPECDKGDNIRIEIRED